MKFPIKQKMLIASLITLSLLVFSIKSASAQSPAETKKWNFLTDVYLLFPNISGEAGLEDLISVPIDANPGDIFSNLKIGGMLYFEASVGKWALSSDLVFMNLENEITETTLLHSGTVKANQGIWEAAALYRLLPFLELGVGGRLNHLNTSMDVRRFVFPAGTEEVIRESAAWWYDPVIITRLSAEIHEKWLFQFRGDMGGFGIGSDFTWQVQGYAGYRFSKVFQLTAGYRLLSVDYDKTTDSKPFIFDVDEFGPVIRFGFNF